MEETYPAHELLRRGEEIRKEAAVTWERRFGETVEKVPNSPKASPSAAFDSGDFLRDSRRNSGEDLRSVVA